LPGNEKNAAQIEDQLRHQLRLKTNLAYSIEFHDLGSLPRYALKARRFKDLRKTH
jgi:phenylacetate-CoA ligase